MFLAFPLGNWRVSIETSSTTSIRFSWQNLQTLVGQQASHYFIFVKDSSGRGLNEYIVPGNNTSHVVSGLTVSREYRLSVAGVNYSGNAYNSTEITAWTDEGGTCNISKDFCCCCCCLYLVYHRCMQTNSQYVKNDLVIETPQYPNWSREVCSRCLRLYRNYSISFSSSDVGEFFWSWILKGCIKVQEKKKKVIVLCSRPPQKVKLSSFTS